LDQFPLLGNIRTATLDKGNNVLIGYDPSFITQTPQDFNIFWLDEQGEDFPGVVSAEP
jgi:hypothetical protein